MKDKATRNHWKWGLLFVLTALVLWGSVFFGQIGMAQSPEEESTRYILTQTEPDGQKVRTVLSFGSEGQWCLRCVRDCREERLDQKESGQEEETE